MDLRPQLLITRGLPACGKTTWARSWVAEDPDHRAHFNRDDHRVSMHGSYRSAAADLQVTIATQAAIGALLAAGIWVIEASTNLVPDHLWQLQLVAARANVCSRVVDLTSVPLQLCVDRNQKRPPATQVPEEYIRALHRSYIAGSTGGASR